MFITFTGSSVMYVALASFACGLFVGAYVEYKIRGKK